MSARFLEQPGRFLFFTGRGGVGKTAVACAMLCASLFNRPTPIPDVDGLFALNIDPALRCAEIESHGWVIHSSLAATGSAAPCLDQRIAAELEQIEFIRQQHARRFAGHQRDQPVVAEG